MVDKFCLWLAWRLPRRVAYWATARVGAYATQGEWSDQVVPTLTLMDAMRRWSSRDTIWAILEQEVDNANTYDARSSSGPS
jgi:hypothetical protein